MTNTDYIELRAHSAYSLLRGTSSPEALLAEAARLGMRGLALTDHNNVYGAISFQKTAGALDIQPILGAELTIESHSAEEKAPSPLYGGGGWGRGQGLRRINLAGRHRDRLGESVLADHAGAASSAKKARACCASSNWKGIQRG